VVTRWKDRAGGGKESVMGEVSKDGNRISWDDGTKLKGAGDN